MGDQSGISWTNATWNPTVGCSLVSPGCTFCYAMKQAWRIVQMQPESHYKGTTKLVKGIPVWTGKLNLAPDNILARPLQWKKPRLIFVNSMSDLFHESVTDGQIMQVFAIMARCPQHKFQILTKRAKRMWEFFSKWADLEGEDFNPKMVRGPEETRKAHPSGRGQLFADMLEAMGPVPKGAAYPTFDWMDGMINWPDALPNVWLGVSCEDQLRANERVPYLRKTPAAVRFVSAEPLLGPIDFRDIYNGGMNLNALTGENWLPGAGSMNSQTFSGAKLDWIIVGGESGKNFRPMNIGWAEQIRDDCKRAGTKFFFKQDSGPKSGKQGRASAELWNCKEFPQ